MTTFQVSVKLALFICAYLLIVSLARLVANSLNIEVPVVSYVLGTAAMIVAFVSHMKASTNKHRIKK